MTTGEQAPQLPLDLPSLHHQLVREALRDHGTAPLAVTPQGDAENVTFRVDTPHGPRLLRLKPPGRLTAAQVDAEMVWLQALRRSTALDVPEPLPFPDGTFVRTLRPPHAAAPWLAVMLRWVEGERRPDRLTPTDTRRMGQVAAALHAHAEEFAPPQDFQRPHLLTDPYFHGWESMLSARTDLTAPEREVVREAARVAVRALNAAARGEVRTHLLHGDLHQGNVVFTAERVGVIDFDDCQFGPAPYDLAATIAHLSLPDHDGKLRDAFLVGYEETRPLWPRERELLGAFVTARHLWMLRWILERDGNPAFADWAPGYRTWQLTELARHVRTARSS